MPSRHPLVSADFLCYPLHRSRTMPWWGGGISLAPETLQICRSLLLFKWLPIGPVGAYGWQLLLLKDSFGDEALSITSYHFHEIWLIVADSEGTNE